MNAVLKFSFAGAILASLASGWSLSGTAKALEAPSLLDAPASDIWGKVLDISTGRPIRGVDVMEQSKEKSEDGLPICAHLAVTDTAGHYGFEPCERATITYTAIGYKMLRLVYPDDLRCDEEDSCCGRLRDVKLTASRGWFHEK